MFRNTRLVFLSAGLFFGLGAFEAASVAAQREEIQIRAESQRRLSDGTVQADGNAVNVIAAGNTLTFTINGVSISYDTVPGDAILPATLALNVVNEINADIATYNTAVPANVPKVNITAVVGDDTNGGVSDSIVLQNTFAGDETQIVVAGLDGATVEADLGFPTGVTTTYTADASNNTGEITLFSEDPFTLEAGVDGVVIDPGAESSKERILHPHAVDEESYFIVSATAHADILDTADIVP